MLGVNPDSLTPETSSLLLLTFIAQQVGVEAEEVGAEVEPALAGHPASPAAAGEVGDQFLFAGQGEPGLKPEQRLAELLWFVLLHQTHLPLLGNQTLRPQNM